MQDANEMECLFFEVAIRNVVLGKVTKSGDKLIINIFNQYFSNSGVI